jgi:hypothetical protein
MSIVDLWFVGHLGPQQLAAAAMGNTVWATVALPLVGCASALDTFLSQSYGAKQYGAYARWTQVRLRARPRASSRAAARRRPPHRAADRAADRARRWARCS